MSYARTCMNARKEIGAPPVISTRSRRAGRFSTNPHDWRSGDRLRRPSVLVGLGRRGGRPLAAARRVEMHGGTCTNAQFKAGRDWWVWPIWLLQVCIDPINYWHEQSWQIDGLHICAFESYPLFPTAAIDKVVTINPHLPCRPE